MGDNFYWKLQSKRHERGKEACSAGVPTVGDAGAAEQHPGMEVWGIDLDKIRNFMSKYVHLLRAL